MSVYPLASPVGPLAVRGFGIWWRLAFFCAGWALQLELRRRGLDEEFAADVVIGGVVGGLVGAKLWYVALTGEALFSRGGFVWYGGFIGGVLGVVLNSWRRRVPIAFTAELVAPALALGYAIGRVGCFLVGDDYGVPTTLPWGVKFPDGLPPSTVANLTQFQVAFPPGTSPFDVVAVHPTQVYETALMLLATAWLWKHRVHSHAAGWLFGCYLMAAGVERFVIEVFRAKDDRLLGDFTVAQLASVGLVVVGVVLVTKLTKLSAVNHQPSALARKDPASS